MRHGLVFPHVFHHRKIPKGKQIVDEERFKGNDQWQRIEYVYSQLAKKSGINIPNTHLIIGDDSQQAHFAIERFDITPNGQRFHVHTLAGITGLNFRSRMPSCGSFLNVVARVTRNQQDVVEAYRRIVFNFLGSNLDDHAKNFSFIMSKNGEWSFSPVYDVGFSSGNNSQHLMRINDKYNNVFSKDLKILALDFNIASWQAIAEQTIDALQEWPETARQAGVNEKLIYSIGIKIKEHCKRVEQGFGAVIFSFVTSPPQPQTDLEESP